jgi:CSLREA domain-containing protein
MVVPALMLAPAVAGAASITVNSTSDGLPAADGHCTLREAITNSNDDSASSITPGECAAGSGADTIDFTTVVTPAITLVGPLPLIDTSITITGPGASLLDVQRHPSAGEFRIFGAQRIGGPPPSLSLSGLTISGGKEVGGLGATSGGGVYSYGFNLSLDHVIVEDNALEGEIELNSDQASTSLNGAGVAFIGFSGDYHLTITDSVVRDNSASAHASYTGPGGGFNPASASASGVGVHASGGSVTIERTTVSGNSATASSVSPNSLDTANVHGALSVSNNEPGSVIAASTISGNSATTTGEGPNAIGGVAYLLDITLDRVTVTGNSATATGEFPMATGGVDGAGGTIVSSTIAGNTSGSPGQIANLRESQGDAPAIRNTIVANPLGGANCDLDPAPIEDHNLEFPGTSCGFTGTGSLQNTDPAIGALAANGGPTETLALPAGSAALDRIPAAGCALTDQRGLPRPQTAGTPCDIGAFELQVPDGAGPPPPAPGPPIYAGNTGLRENALRRCFKKKFRGHRKKCRKKARKLPK